MVDSLHKSLVSVWMVTYNHEAYIEQAIESVMMQTTNFDFHLYIGEDCSTDNTGEICERLKTKYPKQITLVRNKKNLGANNNALNIYNLCFNSDAKYVAMLEGDDYWTDPLKLQKQVDFLESNTDFNICWAKYKISIDSKLKNPEWEIQLLQKSTKFYEVNYNNFATPYCTYTLTTVFRKKIFDNINIRKFKYFKDNTLFCLCLRNSKGAVLNFYSSIYRIQNEGIYSTASDFNKAKSNYLNFDEILRLIPESRTTNVYLKRKIWKRMFLGEINKLPISKVKKRMINLKLYFNLNF